MSDSTNYLNALGTNYFPELNYSFYKCMRNEVDIVLSDINFPQPDASHYSFVNSNNIFELLFSDGYYSTDYLYKFEKLEMTNLPRSTREILKSTYININVYLSGFSETSLDFFNFEGRGNTIQLFDYLLDYKLGNSPDFSDLDYSSLESALEKLIYVYLDFNVNSNYLNLNERINEISLMDDFSSLEKLYSMYVLNNSHKKISLYKFFTDNVVYTTRPIKKRIEIDETNVDEIILTEDIPYEEAPINFYMVGNLLNNSNFITSYESGTFSIKWNNNVSISVGDILIVDYFVQKTIST